jgi:hypothetical protein
MVCLLRRLSKQPKPEADVDVSVHPHCRLAKKAGRDKHVVEVAVPRATHLNRGSVSILDTTGAAAALSEAVRSRNVEA